MSPSVADIEQALNSLGQTFGRLEPLAKRIDSGKKINNNTKETSEAGAAAQKGQSAFQRLQEINAQTIWAARNVQNADQIMDTIGKYLEEMKAQLTRIIKNYPPFPPGSEDRVKILRSYSALRKQIDDLTFQTQDQKVAKAIADSIAIPQKKDSKNSTIPKLSETSTDQEIAATIKNLDLTHETVQEDRTKLAKETLGTFSQEVVKKKWAELEKDGKAVDPGLSERAAELKSKKVGQTLSTEPTNLIDTQTSFLNLLSEGA